MTGSLRTVLIRLTELITEVINFHTRDTTRWRRAVDLQGDQQRSKNCCSDIHHVDVALLSNSRLAIDYQECVAPAANAGPVDVRGAERLTRRRYEDYYFCFTLLAK